MSLRKNELAWIGICVAALLIGTAAIIVIASQMSTATVRIGDGVFRASIARSTAEHTRGLSGRQLGEHEAMLFIFPAETTPQIWMKDMKIAIDAVWLDSTKKVVHLEQQLRPDSYPTVYGTPTPARYVLELPAGSVAKNAITLGTHATFEVKD